MRIRLMAISVWLIGSVTAVSQTAPPQPAPVQPNRPTAARPAITPSATPLPSPASPEAVPSVNSPELNEKLAQLETRLKLKASGDRSPSIDLLKRTQRAMVEGRPSLAIDALEVLAGRNDGRGEGGARTWTRLAMALQATRPVGSPAPAEAAVAAYGAYRRALNDQERLEGLSLLGNILIRNLGYNPSDKTFPVDDLRDSDTGLEIENPTAARKLALQVFSTLARMAADDRFKTRVDQLTPPEFKLARVTYPPPPHRKRPYEDSCDIVSAAATDSTQQGGTAQGQAPTATAAGQPAKVECADNPQNYVCLEFARSIDPRLPELAKLITVDRIDAPTAGGTEGLATAQATKLCYANLKFGGQYQFTISKDLKLSDGTPFAGPFQVFVNMPGLLPSLGFKRGTYVLPSNGDQSILLRTVNVRSADLRIRRIGDPNLFRELVVRHIVGDIDQKSVCFILREVGEPIADGTLKISGTPNATIEYKLPIKDILSDRKQWLTTASPGETKPFSRTGASNALSLKLQPAPVSSGTLNEHAGVFVMFGSESGNFTYNDSGAANDYPECQGQTSTQWFTITNVGLTLQRSSAQIYVIAREFDSGKPIVGATIEFLSRSGVRLDTQQTDANGIASIPARIGRGVGANQLVAVIARRDQDLTFLDLTSDAVNLADRGFDGRSSLTDIEAFVAPARDVYRPGEHIQGVVFIRGADGLTLAKAPRFQLALLRSDTADSTQGAAVVGTRTDFNPDDHPAEAGQQGGYYFDVPIPELTTEGWLTLEVSAYGRAIGSTPIDVRHFQPFTARITPTLESWTAKVSESGVLQLNGTPRADYLYGVQKGSGVGTDAPAAGLNGDLEIRTVAAKTPFPGCFEGFTFGRSPENTVSQIIRDQLLQSDQDGRLAVNVTSEGVSYSNVPLQAKLRLSVSDVTGIVARSSFDVPMSLIGRRWIGIKQREGNPKSGPTMFDVVFIDDQNKPVRERVWVTAYAEQMGYEWSKDGNSWDYVRNANSARVNPIARLSVDPAAPGTDAAHCPNATPFQFAVDRAGSYVLVLSDESGTTTTEYYFGVGWTSQPDGAIKPDALRVRVMQGEAPFPPGSSIDITVETPHRAGVVLGELVARGRVVGRFEAPINVDPTLHVPQANAKVIVGGDWPEGAMFIYATSFRKAEADSVELGPGRAIGGTRIRIGSGGKPAAVAVDRQVVPAKLTTLQVATSPNWPIAIRADGLKADGWAAIAVVDEGVLAVSNFKTPDPHEFYFGRKRLDFDVFDNYGHLLYGNYGAGPLLEDIRGSNYRPGDIVYWHSGVVRLTDGRVTVNVPHGKIPAEFQGQVRIMVWAWDAENVASSEYSVTLRDPVIVQASTPRIMAVNDTAQSLLRVTNLDGAPEGEQLDVIAQTSGQLSFATSPAGVSCGNTSLQTCRRFTIEAKKGAAPTVIAFPLQADAVGEGKIEFSYTLHGQRMDRTWPVSVRQPYPRMTRAVAQTAIPAHGQRTVRLSDIQQLGAQTFDLRTLQVAVQVSQTGAVAPSGDVADAEANIHQLNQLADALQLILLGSQNATASAVGPSANSLVDEIVALQQPDGSFAQSPKSFAQLISAGKNDDAFNLGNGVGQTAFAIDVLLRAKAAKIVINDSVIERGLAYLMSELSDTSDCSASDIYALIVLVKADKLSKNAFDQVADLCQSKLNRDPSKTLLLAAAYNAFGQTSTARQLAVSVGLKDITAIADNPADAARTAALLLENPVAQLSPMDLLTKVGLTQGGQADTISVTSWLSRANGAAMAILRNEGHPSAGSSISIAPPAVTTRPTADGLISKRLGLGEFPQSGVQIENRGDMPLQMNLLLNGVSTDVANAQSNGFDIVIKRVDVAPNQANEFKQFHTAYFTVEINQTDAYSGRQSLAAVQLFPTGFEGINATFDRSWLNLIGNVVNADAISVVNYAEFQEDRWIALPKAAAGPQHHLLGLAMRPNVQGKFIFPPLLVHDLNNPSRVGWSKPFQISVVAPDSGAGGAAR